jgi:polyadenylate-binding protein
LFQKFKECGTIVSLRIVKERSTQKSKGYAYISYSNQDFAEEARKRFNNTVLIKNVIRVKPSFNIHQADKKANIFINNLDDSVDIQELE